MEKLVRTQKWLVVLLMLAMVVVFAGCSGDDGSNGVAGPAGQDGQDGNDGQDGVSATGLTLAAKPLTIENLVFGTNAEGFLTATFDAATGSTPVTGMTDSVTSIALTGLLSGTDGASDEWTYWGASTDALVENSAGNYTLTTDKKVADAPDGTTVQRALIQFNNGAAFERANAVYDFLTTDPATQVASGKEVVNDASCKECHGFGVTIHSFSRNDVKACAVCHSPNYNDTIADHEADLVTMVHKIHSGKADVLGNLHWNGHGDAWGIDGTGDNAGKDSVKQFVYPMRDSMLNCDKCHNTVEQADNWKTQPTMVACGSCHNTVTFDGVASTGIKGASFTHLAQSNNANCTLCHNADYIATKHTPAANRDADQRTVEATITGVTVDEAGGVTVSFGVTDGGVAKTDVGTSGTSLTLAKLVPATAAAPSYWQSYLSQLRTKDTTKNPVVQGRTESAADGVLTNNGDGTYTYKFGLLNGDGNINTVTRAMNRNQDTPANGPNEMAFAVAYEPSLTHRVALSLTNIKTQAFYDFVPDGSTAETRNIVNRESCDKCHGDSQLHAGIAVEYCVGCHNKNSFDPFSGPVGDNTALLTTDDALFGTQTVELGTIVHKIHMGNLLPSVKEGGSYTINNTHDYTKAQYPAGLPVLNPAGTMVNRSREGAPFDCMFCHDESNEAMTEAANWRNAGPACANCHDGAAGVAHIGSNVFEGSYASCATCHAEGRIAPVEEAHYGVK